MIRKKLLPTFFFIFIFPLTSFCLFASERRSGDKDDKLLKVVRTEKFSEVLKKNLLSILEKNWDGNGGGETQVVFINRDPHSGIPIYQVLHKKFLEVHVKHGVSVVTGNLDVSLSLDDLIGEEWSFMVKQLVSYAPTIFKEEDLNFQLLKSIIKELQS